ncbi:Molybdopterin-guanine dinucleotide biosynthesis protein B [uncultured Roseburia sp.]|uniref:Probable molybdenum cofactor guanylyltransferase n=1 Tax=Brotonthovivens ammoniilytica TaxID=2981725 RepID=A0ABT2THP2_9FIRM|nr:molybdopterin-guanine dinucleotide biosynthesis protein B [Brotonthovivens ammoniilytica]MCU6761723.1 molybdopterin-guanine dinucleotide biosynthesis protein B [Brotonthovivens ammoniilytica]SCI44596.1 Molybdopterin-guanine dinucleotide biosynthesis protein B [uncultured Roseburia sp.]
MTKALVILCGGKSSRMGTDKAFLPFGTDSLLNYQIKRFRSCFEHIYISVQDKQDKSFDYSAYCGCREIPDLYPGIGPIGGLYSCLMQIPEDIIYFNAVDTPFSSPELALDLCEELSEHPEYAICLLRNPAGEIQPLQGAYTKSVLPAVNELIQSKRYALRGIFDRFGPHIYETFHKEEQFFNMNNPYSYYLGLQMLAQKSPGSFPVQFTGTEKKCKIPALSFTAKSGTGKTTYLEKLIPLLKKQGLKIAVLKHDAHGFQMDKPGKDSYRLTQAGADHMILTSRDQTAAIFTHPAENPDLKFLMSKIKQVDFILTEGYKLENMPKIELLRKGYNETLTSNPENLLGVVCDFPFETDLPVFPLNEPGKIVPFLMQYIKEKPF